MSEEDAVLFAVTSDEDVSNEAVFDRFTKSNVSNAMRKEMTEDESRNYRAIRALSGDEAAEMYLDELAPSLAARPWEKLAKESPVAASLMSIMDQGLSGIAMAENALNSLSDRGINPYSGMNQLSIASGAIRSTVANDVIGGGAGSVLYQAAMSVGDMAFSMLAGWALSAGTATTGSIRAMMHKAQPIIQGIMSSSAATSATINAKQRGLTDAQALTLGVIAGFAEYITEKYSVEKAIADPKNVIGYWVKNYFTEGIEEPASNLLNTVADVLVAGEKSEWRMNVNYYMQEKGMSEKDAFGAAFVDKLKELGMDFVVGSLAGGIMAAPVSIYTGIQRARTKRAKNAGALNVSIKRPDVQAESTQNGDFKADESNLPYDQKTPNLGVSDENTDNSVVSNADTAVNGELQYDFENSDVSSYTNGYDVSVEEDWAAQNANTEGRQNVTSLSEIVEDIKNSFGVAISKGKIRQRGALGIFKTRSEAIRTRTSNDVPVISHELGHYFDKTYSLRNLQSMQTALDVLTETEPDFAVQYTRRELGGEAIAEFVRRYMTDRTTARQDYGQFYNDFVERLGVKEIRKLDAIADKVNAYMRASEYDRMSAAVSTSSEHRKAIRKSEGTRRAAKRILKSVNTVVFDDALPIKDVSDEAYRQYYHAKKSNAIAENGIIKGEYMVAFDRTAAPMRDTNGNIMFDENGETMIEKTLQQEISPILTEDSKTNRQIENDFSLYLVCRRGLELPGKRVFADPTLDTPEAMQRQIDALEEKYPKFRETAEDLYRWERSLLYTWGVETGIVSRETFNLLGEKYKAYVPLQRLIDPKSGKAKKNSGQPIKSIHGSGLDIIRPIDSISVNAQRLVSMSNRNAVLRTVGEAADTQDGLGSLIERVPPDVVQNSISTDALLRAMDNAGIEHQNGLDVVEWLNANYGNRLYEYGVSRTQSPDIVTVMNGSQRTYYQVHDKALLDALSQLNPTTVSMVLEGANHINRYFKLLTTGANFVWNITKNLAADFQTAFVNSTENNLFKFCAQSVRAFCEVVGNSIGYKAYKAAGGGYSSYIGQNTKSIETLTNELFDTSAGTVKGKLQSLVEKIESLNNAIEQTQRYAENKRALALGYSPADAVYAADEITTNFGRSGRLTKEVDKVAAYTNAAVQGLYREIQQCKNHPLGFTLKCTIPAILLAALVHGWNSGMKGEEGEEEYRKLSTHQKNNYYCFYTGDGKFTKITKARSLSILESLFERAWESFAQKNPDAWKDIDDYILTNLNPVGSNPIISTMNDIIKNESFSGSSIVPKNMESLPDKEQYDGNTTYLARMIGNFTGWSPMKIDYAIDQTTGILGDLNKMIAPTESSSEFFEKLQDTLGRANLRADAAYSTDALNVLYDERDSLEKRKNSIQNKDYEAAGSYKAYSAILNTISDITKYGKANGEERACRLLARDEAVRFRETFSSDDALTELYQRTSEEGVFPYRSFKTEFSYDGEKYAIHPTDVISMMDDYNDAVEDAYADVMEMGLSDKETVAALLKAKDDIYESVKAKYAAISLGECDEEAPIATNSCGLSDGQYAVYRSILSGIEADKDEDGKTISGSKKKKVCEAIDEFCDEHGLSREVKYRLYAAEGYGESSVNEVDWFRASDQRSSYWDDLWKKKKE